MIFFSILHQKYVAETAHNVTLHLLPIKSRKNYELQYELFVLWLNENNVGPKQDFKNILLAYFSKKAKVLQSPTLRGIIQC